MTKQWTILEALKWTEERLERNGEENARLAAQMLATHATKLTRIDLYAQFDKPLSEEERALLRESIQRRLNGEPLQYILGSTGFRYLELTVREPVLIPRPETETLVELVLAHCRQGGTNPAGAAAAANANANATAATAATAVTAVTAAVTGIATAATATTTAAETAVTGAAADDDATVLDDAAATATTTSTTPAIECSILDIGTGSGAIALSLLHELPSCKVLATDIDEAALQLAEENAQGLNLTNDNRLEILKDDLASSLIANEAYKQHFDVVVSNPPYIPTSKYEALPQEILQFESKTALDGGEDGLHTFRRLAEQAQVLLRYGGLLAVELHEDTLKDAAAFAGKLSYSNIEIHNDLTGRQRFITAIRS